MLDEKEYHRAFTVVGAICNSLNIEIATASHTYNQISFDLGYMDDVEYHIKEKKLLLAEGHTEHLVERVTRTQYRILCGIAYENGLTVEEFE